MWRPDTFPSVDLVPCWPWQGVPVSCSWRRRTRRCGPRRRSWRRSTRWRRTWWWCGSAGRSESECHVTPIAHSENDECSPRWTRSTTPAPIHCACAHTHVLLLATGDISFAKTLQGERKEKVVIRVSIVDCHLRSSKDVLRVLSSV